MFVYVSAHAETRWGEGKGKVCMVCYEPNQGIKRGGGAARVRGGAEAARRARAAKGGGGIFSSKSPTREKNTGASGRSLSLA